MQLVQAAIRFPVSVMVAVLLGVLFGMIALSRIPIQMIPTLDKPEITVNTRYPGAGPLEVEEEITNRQEELLNTVENLRELLSTSQEGQSTILLKYDWGTNKDVARMDVSEKLSAVRDLPDDAEESIIRAVNSNQEQPIGWIVLQADEEINAVRPMANDVIKGQLERVEGVAQVLFFGGQEREIHVQLDFLALSARDLTIADVRRALVQENRDIKAGAFNEGKRRFGVRTRGRYRKLEDISETIIRWDKGGPIRVKNVARVKLGHEEPDYVIRFNGEPALIMGVLRKTGSNALQVMTNVKEVLERMGHQYAQRGIRLHLVYDASDYIHAAIGLVRTSLLIGAALATGVLLFFLRSRSAVLVLGLSIPIVILSSFIFIAVLGRTINIISLAGMAFVTGMILDNAIVVVENIFRHRELGKGPARAAYDGTVEVWGAILASTLTTLAVFLPIILVEEEAGQIFRDIAIVISVTVALSLVVAITVIPMLSARLLQSTPRTLRAGNDAAHRLSRPLLDLLGWIMAKPRRKVGVIAGIVGLSVLVAWGLHPPIDYMPEGNRNLMFVVLKTPPVYNLKQSERIVRLLEERIIPHPKVARMFTIVRHANPNLGIVLKSEHKNKRSIRAFMDEIKLMTRDVAGVRQTFVRQIPLIRRGTTGSGNIEVRILGANLEGIQEISDALEEPLARVPGVEFVNPSFEIGKPDLIVDVDRVRAAELGLTVSDVGTLVESLVNGIKVGHYDDGGREIDLILRGPEEIGSPEELERTMLHTPSGQTVQLADLAHIRSELGPTQIEHTDMDRSIKLSIGVEVDAPLGAVMQRIEDVVAPVRAALPLGYSVELGGQADDLTRTWRAFRGSLLLAILITYLLLASLFESFRLPIVILVTMPFAASGGIIALKILNSFDPTVKLDVITMLGFVILVGLVVNNAILLVHQALNRMSEGAPMQEAVLNAVSTRVRPIFMTMTTTVFGMSPLVFAQGAGSELYRGLAAILVGGLILSTLFTLILVPTLLTYVLRQRDPVAERAGEVSAGGG